MMKVYSFWKKLVAMLLMFTVISHMAVPIYAMGGISNENLSTNTVSLVRYNVQSDTSEVIEIPTNELLYPNIGTHSLLDTETQAAVAAMEDGGVQTYGIIGHDDRDQELPASSVPFSGLVLIHMWSIDTDGFNGYTPGTGFLVAPNVIVTAAHCVTPPVDRYDIVETMTALNIYSGVSAAASGVSDLSVYPNVDWTDIENIYYPDEYLEFAYDGVDDNAEDIYDWAVITLNTSFSGYVFNCFCVTNPETMIGMNVSIAGYPSDFPHWIYHGVGSIVGTIYNESMITYNVDTSTGQSGSPVYRNSITEGRRCYGIHTHAHDSFTNSGKLITMEVYNAITTAIADASS